MNVQLELSRKACRYRLRRDHAHGPPCPHGPTLPFDRLDADDHVTASFYACSACRDRKQCNFYLPLASASRLPRQRPRGECGGAEAAAAIPGAAETATAYVLSSHRSCYEKLQLAVERQPHGSCQYCHDCDVTLSATAASGSQQRERGGAGHHVGHRLTRLAVDTARHPTVVLSPKEDNKTNAQFFFTRSTTDFLITCLRHLQVRRLVCIGTPRLHETVSSQQRPRHGDGSSSREEGSNLSSFLLDLDSRFRHFFGPDEFAQYNMFNHHFFAGPPAVQSFTKFCTSGPGKAAIVVDPPYGGMLEALDATLRKVTDLLAAGGSIASPGLPSRRTAVSGAIAPCFLFLPYYLEPQVLEHLEGFHMLDYRVSYENHAKYSNRSKPVASAVGSQPLSGRTDLPVAKSSPARIFTNVPPDLIELPAAEGYRFCAPCRRWTWSENKHCVQCNACTTKHGSTYVHCPHCDRCVKPSWKHCATCGKCVLQGEGSRHACGQAGLGETGTRTDVHPRSGKRKDGSRIAAGEQLQPRQRKRPRKGRKAVVAS